jgi:peptidyl-prolyl cis-trans isomerase C/foldase protein PrsA
MKGWGLALGLLVLAGCHRMKQHRDDPAVIATVNGERLTRAEFEHQLSREIESTDSAPPTAEQLAPIKKALLDTLVKRMLLLQVAREKNVTVPPAAVDRAVLRIRADYPTDGFDQALSQAHLSLAELKKDQEASLTVLALFEREVYPRVGVTEAEIHDEFDAHEADFSEPEQVHAAQIVVKELDEAKRVQQLLRQGHKFADLARKYSLSADAKVGGDLGFFPRGQMPPPFDEVCFKLGVGQVSDVVATEYGFHLFKVLAKRPARKQDFAQVRQEIERRLLDRKREKAQADYVQALEAKAQIHVNEAVLAAVRAPSVARAVQP